MAKTSVIVCYPSLAQSSPTLPVIVRLSGWELTRPSHSYGPTIRDYYLLHYIVKGKGNFCIDNNTYTLSAGDGFIIPPGVVTYYEADRNDPWEYYWVGWDGEHAQSVLEDLDYKIPKRVYHYPDTKKIIGEFKSLFKTFEKKNNGYNILSRFYSLISNFINIDFATKMHKDNAYLSNAILFIRINYSKDITVKDIAKGTFLSVTHLNRLFRTHLNISVNKYLNNYRLEKAIELIYSSNMNITEIALACGFGSGSYFSYLFKLKTGITPNNYRKDINNPAAKYETH